MPYNWGEIVNNFPELSRYPSYQPPNIGRPIPIVDPERGIGYVRPPRQANPYLNMPMGFNGRGRSKANVEDFVKKVFAIGLQTLMNSQKGGNRYCDITRNLKNRPLECLTMEERRQQKKRFGFGGLPPGARIPTQEERDAYNKQKEQQRKAAIGFQ